MIQDKVSVIITTYKATDRLRDAIKSVLNQTYEHFEVCVVDDNNPDTESRAYTERIIQEFADHPKLKYIKHERNKNGSAARNTGICATDGEFIAFLDDDDIYYSDRLAKCVGALKKDVLLGGVYTHVDIYEDEIPIGVRHAEFSGKIWKDFLLNEGVMGTGSNMFLRRTCMTEIGFFNEAFLRYQDVEYMLRFTEKYALLALPQVLVRKNIQVTNIPEYKKYKANKLLIFNTFGYLINRLSEEERNHFYYQHYMALYRTAIASCNRKNIAEAMIDCEKMNPKLTKKEKLRGYFPRVFKVYAKIRKKLNR
ncbi:MAG: glycosyltransferase family 2 protein [Clostridia bacterium]|nr:glycosyltransferase family 2 protein [Clostridia bacterium]